MTISSFKDALKKFRNQSFSEKDKGTRFEVLMKRYLQIEPIYKEKFKEIWLWNEFPYRKDFGGKDTGIDLVAKTTEGDYWAIQCKCYDEETYINKSGVDSFLATSSKTFIDENLEKREFSKRLWISTTNKWNSEAENTIKNQNPEVIRITLNDLEKTDEYINWNELLNGKYEKVRKAKKIPRKHQETAINTFHEHFKTADRGKLIMACGTGKTFTSLKIAEKETENKGVILFLVPSIALLGQTLKEWSIEATETIHPICICSDSSVGKEKEGVIDLPYPASTNIQSIIKQYNNIKKHEKGMKVVFSTYQSIDVIATAQKEINKQEKDSLIFDLIICDEAHRTTGVILKDKETNNYDEKVFTKVHDNNFVNARKRLYMTATPRLYKEETKRKAEEIDALLCSMDDETIYGREVYRIGFGEAVKNNLLTDYKVLVLTLEEEQIPKLFRNLITGESNNELATDDISKLIGCINALSKRVIEKDKEFNDDPNPMKRAVAFCQSIKISENITKMFNEHKGSYYNSLEKEEREKLVGIESKHIDGSIGASQRDELLGWLKDASEDGKECRILTNVRCLSEGVDVPSLDSVIFLSSKNSQVDVVQSVGRVMRLSPNKKYGYIIIPIMIPAGIKPEEALNDNKKYSVIWSVLNALRAHDDRFDAEVNKTGLNKDKRGRFSVIGIKDKKIIDDINNSDDNKTENSKIQLDLPLEELREIQNVIYAKMVQKVGNKRYWVQWAQDVGKIAQKYIEKINNLITKDGEHQQKFNILLNGLKKNINPSISQDEVIEMLAQHLITAPVFEALFEDYSFVDNNPVSKSLKEMIELLEEESMKQDKETLNKFYESVKERVSGIDNAEGKQKIIIELYDKFFKTAFPKTVEKLGIVYTPVEVVDFINNSVAQVLKKEFNRELSDENVHILDPFTGTGTFITRLIQTGLIKKEFLQRKYERELHANEIVLLAYYIASINIENTYHDVMGTDTAYKAFNGICLTDTFQLSEDEKQYKMEGIIPLQENSERVMEQKKLPVKVIIGNPPYSVGQKSSNDNAQNQSYPNLENRITETYAKFGTATNKNSLYDSYIKAFRWSSDRIDENSGGIVAFITNSGWLDANGMDGFRNCLEKEFNSIYIFNLKGAIRGKSKDASAREGQNVFDIMTGVAITILVKNPKIKTDKAIIYYHDIGHYLKRTKKLEILKTFKNIDNSKIEWKILKPNKHNDWLNQRSDLFSSFIPLNPNKKYSNENTFFYTYSRGLLSGRDAWCYNFSKQNLSNNMNNMIDFYNTLSINNILYDKTKISWTRSLLNDLKKEKKHIFEEVSVREGIYRPFLKQYVYFNKDMNDMIYQQPKLFPTPEHKNICICVPGIGNMRGFSALIVNFIPDLGLNSACQCFPLYYYEKQEAGIGNLFDKSKEEYIRKDGITDFILSRCEELYRCKLSKEDIFYYVYGLLHSKDYRTEFMADLKKMLPRIPLVDIPNDFWKYSKAGRELAELHLNYETMPAYKDVKVIGEEKGNFKVNKLSFARNGKELDKTTIIYNSSIKITNIPLIAYEYIVNGKSALEWIMDRYQVKVDKDSGIKNDPNDWAIEHNNPRYILNLILSVITVSVETVKIVNNLPKIEFK